MKKPVEFFDTDFLGTKIEIGDQVIIEEPKFRNFIIGTVVTKAPKSCQVEYVDFLGDKKITRQYYGQMIKHIVRTGKWVFPEYAGEKYYKCTCCNKEYPVPFMWTADDVIKQLVYCSSCGVKNG